MEISFNIKFKFNVHLKLNEIHCIVRDINIIKCCWNFERIYTPLVLKWRKLT